MNWWDSIERLIKHSLDVKTDWTFEVIKLELCNKELFLVDQQVESTRSVTVLS